MRVMLFAALLSVVALPVPSLAGSFPPGDQTFSVLSDGATTCGEFVAANQNDRAGMLEWVFGFLSGLNAGSAGKMRYVGHTMRAPQTVSVWLTSYCEQHALDNLTGAALALRVDYIAHERPR
jgi:hypothetical protein